MFLTASGGYALNGIYLTTLGYLGEKISAGELAKALQIIADGGDIDYVGASDVELIGPGEAAGNYRVVGYEGGAEVTAGRK